MHDVYVIVTNIVHFYSIAYCKSPCLNGGKCVKPNQCDCLATYKNDPEVKLSYTGAHCETRKYFIFIV